MDWRDKDDLDLTHEDLVAMAATGVPVEVTGPEDSTRMSGAPGGSWSLCCMGGWRRVLCVLDNVNHEYLGNRLKRVCDLHDRAIVGWWKRL